MVNLGTAYCQLHSLVPLYRTKGCQRWSKYLISLLLLALLGLLLILMIILINELNVSYHHHYLIHHHHHHSI
jgi:hypothetical protein